MSESLQDRILNHIQSTDYRPQKKRQVARQLQLDSEDLYPDFKRALNALVEAQTVDFAEHGTIVLAGEKPARVSSKARSDSNTFTGTYRQNKRGFGFVTPDDPENFEDLFVLAGDQNGAITGDKVRASITNKGFRNGKPMWNGRVLEVTKRTMTRFVGSLAKLNGRWIVSPDGNILTEVIQVPDAGSRHVKPGTKVVVELTTFPSLGVAPVGVITEILGAAGDKDVDLRAVIVQHNLPGDFPDEVKEQARNAVANFDATTEAHHRLDMQDALVCTIDPDDAKDYDDAISLKQVEHGEWELGVHIADVSHFVKAGTPLDLEAAERGNSTYFPGYVIPMLPEILSNGVCSLQEGVPRLCKSTFITYDKDARPVRTRFANTIIHSRKRFRYTEAQDLLDRAERIRHPEGAKSRSDYDDDVLQLLDDMNDLAKRLQKRRYAQGQIVLTLPEVELKLDENGKVIDAVPEDESFTHTLIEMFMVEANESVARLLDGLDVPFLRRTHPEPEMQSHEKLRSFTQATGHHLPKEMDRHSIQALLAKVKDQPDGFAINLAILKSLTRAEYSPEVIGHYALASEHYAHFTSPIRRYADLTIHRLLDAYFDVAGSDTAQGKRKKRAQVVLDDIPSRGDLLTLGKHLSVTERRSDEAERELRRVKILTLLQQHIGENFIGVVTSITNFGIFIQLKAYLVDGLIRYEDLMDDWWDVDERAGIVRGKRSGTKIGVGDVVKARVVKVDLPRRELDLAITEFLKRSGKPAPEIPGKPPQKKPKAPSAFSSRKKVPHKGVTGAVKRSQRSKQRDRRKR